MLLLIVTGKERSAQSLIFSYVHILYYIYSFNKKQLMQIELQQWF